MATTRSKLIKKLDKLFSIFIRTRDVDDTGHGECFTCHSRVFWKGADAGHFQSRGKYATRWNEDNVFLQCKRCNGFRGGEQFLFSKELDAKFGAGKADELVYLSNQPSRYSIGHLEEMINHYKIEGDKQLHEKGLG